MRPDHLTVPPVTHSDPRWCGAGPPGGAPPCLGTAGDHKGPVFPPGSLYGDAAGCHREVGRTSGSLSGSAGCFVPQAPHQHSWVSVTKRPKEAAPLFHLDVDLGHGPHVWRHHPNLSSSLAQGPVVVKTPSAYFCPTILAWHLSSLPPYGTDSCWDLPPSTCTPGSVKKQANGE